MPSSATITAFYDFTANTRARASQVSNNFSAFRGHLIPVEPNTAAAGNLNYDIGSSDHRWRTLYGQSVNFLSNTTTGNDVTMYANTTGAATLNIYAGATQIFNITQFIGETTTAAVGQLARSALIPSSQQATTTAITLVTNSTLTITTMGRPVYVYLGVDDGTQSTSFLFSGQTSTATTPDGYMFLYRDTTTSVVFKQNFGGRGVGGNFALRLPTSSFSVIDTPTSGQHTYFLGVSITQDGQSSLILINSRLKALEL